MREKAWEGDGLLTRTWPAATAAGEAETGKCANHPQTLSMSAVSAKVC